MNKKINNHRLSIAEPRASSQGKRHPRSLLSYLILPRPGDAFKVSIPLSGWLVANALTNWMWWREGLILAVAFEYLICQARYQWNDLQGRIWDSSAPLSSSRGRLPSGKHAVSLSIATIIARISIALALCFSPWHSQIWPVSALYFGVGALAVTALTLVYEQTRRIQRRASTHSFASFMFITLLTIIGYPLRFSVGFLVTASNRSIVSAVPFIGYLIALVLLGLMGATMQWLLEAASYGNFDTIGRVLAVNRKILAKPHIYQNWRYAGFEGELQDDTPMNGAAIFTLKNTGAHIWQIWNLAYFFGNFVSVVSVLATAHQITAWPILAAILIATLTIFEVLARATNGGKAVFVSTLLMLSLVWLATGHQTDQPAELCLLVGLLWLSIYITFYVMNYASCLDMLQYARKNMSAIWQTAHRHYPRWFHPRHVFAPSHVEK